MVKEKNILSTKRIKRRALPLSNLKRDAGDDKMTFMSKAGVRTWSA